MGQVRYTAQISLPTTVVQQASTSPYIQHLNIVRPTIEGCYPTMLPRLDYLPCAYHTTCPDAYLPILIESDEGQIEKALNTRMFRCHLYSPATNVTLSRCPFLWRKCLLQSSLWEVSPQCTQTNYLGLQRALFVANILTFPLNPYKTQKCKCGIVYIRYDHCWISLKSTRTHIHAFYKFPSWKKIFCMIGLPQEGLCYREDRNFFHSSNSLQLGGRPPPAFKLNSHTEG